MKRFKRLLAAASGAAIVGAALIASGGCAAPEPVVGAALPFSGSAARYGDMIRKGIDLAAEEVNAAGGIEGTPVQVVYEDTGTDPEKGKAAARKLIQEHGAVAVIGAVSSTVTLEILKEVMEPAAVVLLSPASSSPTLSGISPFFLRVYPSDALEGGRMADLADNELKLRKLVVFSVADEYGSGYKKTFIERYRRRNREVTKVFNFMPGDRDFGAMVTEVVQLQPEGVFLIGYVDAVVELVKQLRGAGYAGPILSSGSLTAEFPALAGEAAEGVLFSRPSFRMLGNPERVQTFVSAYRAKYNEEPEDYAAYGYDALMVVAQVMKQGNRTARDVQLALRSPASRYEGVTGTIVFGNEGDVVASPTTFIVHQGQIVEYKSYLEGGGTPPQPLRAAETEGGKP